MESYHCQPPAGTKEGKKKLQQGPGIELATARSENNIHWKRTNNANANKICGC